MAKEEYTVQIKLTDGRILAATDTGMMAIEHLPTRLVLDSKRKALLSAEKLAKAYGKGATPMVEKVPKSKKRAIITKTALGQKGVIIAPPSNYPSIPATEKMIKPTAKKRPTTYTVFDTRSGKTFATAEEADAYEQDFRNRTGIFVSVEETHRKVTHTYGISKK